MVNEQLARKLACAALRLGKKGGKWRLFRRQFRPRRAPVQLGAIANQAKSDLSARVSRGDKTSPDATCGDRTFSAGVVADDRSAQKEADRP